MLPPMLVFLAMEQILVGSIQQLKNVHQFPLRVHYLCVIVCILFRVGFSARIRTLDYTKFLKAFEEGRVDQYAPAPADVKHYRQFDHLSPEKAEAKLKKYTTEQAAALTAVSCLLLLIHLHRTSDLSAIDQTNKHL